MFRIASIVPILGVLLALAGASPGSAESLVRGPYLQSMRPDGVVVRWRTDLPVTGVLRFGTDSDVLDGVVVGNEPTTEHVVELDGLLPATEYFYSVGYRGGSLGGGPEFRFRTAPMPGTPEPVRIWVLGDSGTKNANAEAVRDGYLGWSTGLRTDLTLMLGDNAYPSGTDFQYQLAVFDMYPTVLRTTPLWPSLGNHDANSAQSATQTGVYYDIFSLPVGDEAGGIASGTEAYYAFDVANVHFICLDSSDSDRIDGGDMLTWLAADLASTLQDWVIAFWHHPPYSKGSHDSDTGRILMEMRENAVPILEDWGVDAVLAGHSHSYERSFLLDGHYGDSTTFRPAHLLDGGSGEGADAYRKPTSGPSPHEGTVYVVAGSSGQISPAPLDHPAMFRSLAELGSMVLEFHGNRLDAVFLDDLGNERDGFTILKGDDAPPRRPFDLTARPESSRGIALDWTLRPTSIDGLRVERRDSGASWQTVATLPPGATDHGDETVLPGTPYEYRLIGSSATGDSAPSNVARATTPSCPSHPSIADTLRVSADGKGLRADWSAAVGITEYELISDTRADGAFEGLIGVATGGATELEFPSPPEPLVFIRVRPLEDCLATDFERR